MTDDKSREAIEENERRARVMADAMRTSELQGRRAKKPASADEEPDGAGGEDGPGR